MRSPKTEKTHETYSASGSSIWLNCPGSIQAQAEAPPEEENAAALEGVFAHELHERWVKHFAKSPLAFSIPKKFDKKETVDAVSQSVKFLKSKRQKGDEIKVETKTMLDFIHPEFGGTVDVAFVKWFDRLLIYDFKNGYWPVETHEFKSGILYLNTQLVSYALGIANEFDFEFENVELGIGQPRGNHASGNKFRSITVPMEKVRSYEDLFKRAIDRTLSPKAKRFAGKHCKWCKARKTCKEIARFTNAEAAKDFLQIEE